MDPNEALRMLREHFKTRPVAGSASGDWYWWSVDLEDRFNALDEWLSKGGFLPEPWKR